MFFFWLDHDFDGSKASLCFDSDRYPTRNHDATVIFCTYNTAARRAERRCANLHSYAWRRYASSCHHSPDPAGKVARPGEASGGYLAATALNRSGGRGSLPVLITCLPRYLFSLPQSDILYFQHRRVLELSES